MSEILSSPMFIVGAIGLTILALAFVLLPLWRGDAVRARIARRRKALEELRDDLDPGDYQRRLAALDEETRQTAGRAASARGLSALLIVAVPLLAAFLYTQVGTPAGLAPQSGQNAELRGVLGGLARQVREQPENTEAWNRLGMLWKEMSQFPAAEAAFRRVLFIDPADTFARVELAETLLYASGRAQLPDASRKLLDEALASNPDNQKALWLSGLGAFHNGDQQRALELWTRLRDLLPPGNVRDQVEAQLTRITDAAETATPSSSNRTGRTKPHAGIMPDNTRQAPPENQSDPASAQDPAIEVSVKLAPDLADRINGSETVFIFARAVNGPPAPLAVKRLAAADLPAQVMLSDSDSMAQGLSLSTFPSVTISARVSKTGNAIASPGDLQGATEAVAVNDTDRVDIVVDQVIQ